MISACTLPAWLLENIIDSMNLFFGSMLRQELPASELMTRDNLTKSTDLQRLSSESTQGRGGDNNQTITDAIVQAAGYR
jgi:hypothetical protein